MMPSAHLLPPKPPPRLFFLLLPSHLILFLAVLSPSPRRLKVHYRAPPDVRGSGRERGHGRELQACPRCAAPLEAGRHHVGCSAGPVAPRQAAKRLRQVRKKESLSEHDGC